jgi:hypothetical protein
VGNLGHDVSQEVENDLAELRAAAHSLDVEAYIARWLPVKFPNKGLYGWLKRGAKVRVHHELFSLPQYMMSPQAALEDLEVLMDVYGSTHQRDYCVLVHGHRFTGLPQTVELRGVLGRSRLYKLVALLRLAGCDRDQLEVVDHQPNYERIAADDVAEIPPQLDVLAIGAEVVSGKYLSNRFELIQQHRGALVSYSTYHLGSRNVAFTTFPYGELCGEVVQALAAKNNCEHVLFVGSSASLSDQLRFGDIFVPLEILHHADGVVNWTASSALPVPTLTSARHMSVKTPILESLDYLERIAAGGCTSIDVEAAHFAHACERAFDRRTKKSIILYVLDEPRSNTSLTDHDYSDESVVGIRRRLGDLLERLVTFS